MKKRTALVLILALVLLLSLTACGASGDESQTSLSLSAKDESNPVMDNALARLSGVSKELLGLNEEVSDYKAVFSDSVLEVEGVDCQGIILLKDNGEQVETAGTFAVATDDSKIFKYDVENYVFVLIEE